MGQARFFTEGPLNPTDKPMIARLTISLAIASYLALGAGAEPEWLEIDAKPLDWLDSLPMLNPKHSVLVLDMPSATHLRGFAAPSPGKPGLSELQFASRSPGFSKPRGRRRTSI